MNKDQAFAAQRFLSRVDLKGSEVPAFIDVMDSLEEIIVSQSTKNTPNPEDKTPEVGVNGN
ncbi:hypothetical protein AVP1_0061 [Aeromonas phage AVP1]|nr:hypothetical protein AVP1_0061 [Aeromonas phage AVP1]